MLLLHTVRALFTVRQHTCSEPFDSPPPVPCRDNASCTLSIRFFNLHSASCVLQLVAHAAGCAKPQYRPTYFALYTVNLVYACISYV